MWVFQFHLRGDLAEEFSGGPNVSKAIIDGFLTLDGLLDGLLWFIKYVYQHMRKFASNS